MVDGIGDIDDVVLKDRKTLSQDGLVVAVLTLDSETGRMVASPEIVSRGFVYMRDSEELIADTKALLIKETRKFEGADRGDYASIKAGIKNSLKTFLKNRTKRTPMIMTIIIESPEAATSAFGPCATVQAIAPAPPKSSSVAAILSTSVVPV